MWLTILVDIIAIAVGIPIILVATNHGSGNTADHCADGCARPGPDAGENRTSESACAGTDRCSGCGGCNGMVVFRRSCTAA
jgi:hypothetical protein